MQKHKAAASERALRKSSRAAQKYATKRRIEHKIENLLIGNKMEMQMQSEHIMNYNLIRLMNQIICRLNAMHFNL